MFIVPFDTMEFTEISFEVIINDGQNYIINFLFEVIEGGKNVFVCNVKREGLGLRVKLLNKSGTDRIKIKFYKILNPHILDTNHNSSNPILIGNTRTIKVPPGYAEHPFNCTCDSQQSENDLYYFTFKVVDGSKQVYVSNTKVDINNPTQFNIGFYNAGAIDSYIEVSTLEEDFLVSHDRYPPPKNGHSLSQGNYEQITIQRYDFGQAKIKPQKKIVSYTYDVINMTANVYVCGQYFDYEGNLIIDFYNDTGDAISVNTQAWETSPYQST